jgi:hypothetical protein
MDFDNWPKLYWPEELALIREFLSDVEFAELLSRLVRALPDGPLVEWREVVSQRAERELRDPNIGGNPRGSRLSD